MSDSQNDGEQTREGCACVERSKAEEIKQQVGRCHKGHAIAHGPEPPHTWRSACLDTISRK
eukprot:315781-Chlamydomonas_euryale.AAC.1